MPRGVWGASAAHQQENPPEHPGSERTPIASSLLNVACASHGGVVIKNSIFILDALTSAESIEPAKNTVWSPVAELSGRHGACAASGNPEPHL